MAARPAHLTQPAGPDRDSIRAGAAILIAAGTLTAVAGAALLFGLQPRTTVSEDLWRYPWESSSAFVVFSLFSALVHGLVAIGIVAFGRSGAAGRSRAATWGVRVAAVGTVLLGVGEVVSIPVRDALTTDGSAEIVAGVFAVAALTSTAGFLMLGAATLRAGVWQGWRRFTPLAVGGWLCVLNVVPAVSPTALHGTVGVYGLCLLVMAVALYTDPVPELAPAAAAGRLQHVA